jgi:hypothetical protein
VWSFFILFIASGALASGRLAADRWRPRSAQSLVSRRVSWCLRRWLCSLLPPPAPPAPAPPPPPPPPLQPPAAL